MLVPRLIGGGAAQQEGGGVGVVLVERIGVIVGDLVIVPGQHPRRGVMRRLQQRIALVGGVADAIAGEVPGLRILMQAHRILGGRCAFVDVVAEVDNVVDRVLANGVSVGIKEAECCDCVS